MAEFGVSFVDLVLRLHTIDSRPSPANSISNRDASSVGELDVRFWL